MDRETKQEYRRDIDFISSILQDIEDENIETAELKLRDWKNELEEGLEDVWNEKPMYQTQLVSKERN